MRSGTDEAMKQDPNLDLFESLRQLVDGVALNDFAAASRENKLALFGFWSAVAGTPLAPVWDQLNNWKIVASDPEMPASVRSKAFADIKYKIDEVLASLRAGAIQVSRRRLRCDVINKISDFKVRTICLEINSTPDSNVISLLQLLGEALKWSLWYKAKQNNSRLKENGNLKPLLEESIQQKYFTSNAANRFLKDFRDNFLKTSFDMVRHSDTYVPDLTVLNPQFDAFEVILDECF